jgi:hypothetical protein
VQILTNRTNPKTLTTKILGKFSARQASLKIKLTMPTHLYEPAGKKVLKRLSGLKGPRIKQIKLNLSPKQNLKQGVGKQPRAKNSAHVDTD